MQRLWMSIEKQCFLEMTQQLTHGLNRAVCTRLVPSTRVHWPHPRECGQSVGTAGRIVIVLSGGTTNKMPMPQGAKRKRRPKDFKSQWG